MKKRRRCELRSHRRRCLFYALFFLEKSKKSGKQNTGKKFKIPGFLKKHFSELSPRLSPTAFWTAPFYVKKLEKHRISCRNPVFLWYGCSYRTFQKSIISLDVFQIQSSEFRVFLASYSLSKRRLLPGSRLLV